MLEMSDLVKEQVNMLLGDSLHPFVKTAFSSDDMLGNTSQIGTIFIWYKETNVTQMNEMP